MTAVIAVQALLFQDGGLIVMGWNLMNMGALACLSAYAAYRPLVRLAGGHRSGRLAAAFAAAWLSVVVGAVATAAELAASGTAALNLALPAMAGVHALIGIGEGLITTAALALLLTARPALLQAGETSPGRSSAFLAAAGLLVALVLALATPLASSNPDGLNAVAERLGFAGQAISPGWSPLAGYSLPGLGDPSAATMLAVLVGTLIVFALAVAIGRGLRPHGPAAD
jgi:cobalt/nickel transport system permease protein